MDESLFKPKRQNQSFGDDVGEGTAEEQLLSAAGSPRDSPQKERFFWMYFSFFKHQQLETRFVDLFTSCLVSKLQSRTFPSAGRWVWLVISKHLLVFSPSSKNHAAAQPDPLSSAGDAEMGT